MDDAIIIKAGRNGPFGGNWWILWLFLILLVIVLFAFVVRRLTKKA